MENTSHNDLVIYMYHLINLYFGYFLAKIIIVTINDSDNEVLNKTNLEVRIKGDIFEEGRKRKIIAEQDNALQRPTIILAALLPFFIFSAIYFTSFDLLYDFLISIAKIRRLKLVALLFSAFFLGLTSAKLILSINGKDNQLYTITDLNVIRRRLNHIQIFYLSSTLCLIMFSYLDFDARINLIKGFITFFVIGNAVYLIFRPNVKPPRSLFKYLNLKINKSDDVLL